MQVDVAGRWEIEIHQKYKEHQAIMDVGVLRCTSKWRPQGDLNPCRRRESRPVLPTALEFLGSRKRLGASSCYQVRPFL